MPNDLMNDILKVYYYMQGVQMLIKSVFNTCNIDVVGRSYEGILCIKFTSKSSD